ncbi:dGTPase [Arboricoccus pini]|uniref:Deoxyguanosinetriphosphate triphosphohydrolase-like protein n=1 Tax=Arboricoccus pini TaxID=1963835 RepID=A0A212QQ42_9PROT|nr:deoxyguanosinetriphosphate triphosphohydrolase [Arboricoccus pini]SNB61562.1 dGTPase [Arboricoccus pini]
MTLASFACLAEASAGRALVEPGQGLRSCFQRDRDRIVHSTAFRRLENKTQVFVSGEGDHFRTRLTHSLEVAQITRTLCSALGCDTDLGEAVALAHDLGHPPFGHAGERALAEELAAYGGFDHNVQTFRVLTRLEQRYASFDGLNLTFETLEGVLKHNGPLAEPLPGAIARHPVAAAGLLRQQGPVEAQAAALADDVAYCNHDLDDGLRAGFFDLDDLRDVALVAETTTTVRGLYGPIDQRRLHHEVIRRLIDQMVTDIIVRTRHNLAALGGAPSPDLAAIRAASSPVVAFSPGMAAEIAALRAFLRKRMYRHYKVNRMSSKARSIVRNLVQLFMAEPDCLPTHWQPEGGEPQQTADAVRDYIAGMTDRYAFDEYDRLFRTTRDR